jgi:hypothetical protein
VTATGRLRWRAPAVVVLVTVAVLSGGAAFAFWAGPGIGSGTGSTDTTVAVTLSPGAASANLSPGTSASVSTTATNPNGAAVRIGSLALDTSKGTGGFAIAGDVPAGGCSAASFSFVTQTNTGTGWSLPGSGVLAIDLPSSLTMALSAANACQGVTVTVFLVAVP